MDGEAIKTQAEDIVKKRLTRKMIIAFLSSGAGLPLFIGFIAIIVVILLLGEEDYQKNQGYNKIQEECGFTISTTSLSKNDYREKLEAYAKVVDSRAQIFADNADSIYDLAVSSNINPELVIVRAAAEGYSPGASKNNYWGIGCTNTGGYEACKTYSSFLEGVKGFIDNISGYSSLIDMMSKYSYIGDNWTEGSSSEGGCYYFEHIKDYYEDSPAAQASKQNAEKACAAGGTGIKTTEHDQAAYASWQVNNAMTNFRKNIFGLEDLNIACSPSNIVTLSIPELKKLKEADAWKLITSEYTNHPTETEMTQNKMDKMVTNIQVPYRTWAEEGDEVIATVGGENVTKKTQTLTVNIALAELFEDFFKEVYNNAPDFVIRNFGKCYDYRSKTASDELSAHAFGAACDINPTTPGNRFEDTPYKTWEEVQKNVEGKQKYEVIYANSKIIEIAHQFTITNGVDWNTPKDAMHFSFIGDMTRT